ncbi:hypothetical protein EJ082_15115 [Brevundimonas diminuta]|uniref:Uncharacterized protein n=1 Tax=Brevundimonas diminuta TaxID=293 RepID=A0A410P0B7_BREDI|nr:hypothetical protein [Brevundimonas diminuta]MBD3574296.1 hypothetical protein [Brevundimonas diminuta]QAT15547.1 hypothetical protein EQG53_15020 [Brevundimonas diminuta]QQB90236.1 hypothetical protein I6H83_07430 [Brevundimonas diminuta]GEC02243.1 hypothetical protein BDI01nite_33070 [Brevundimonas diminuta]
MSIDGLLTFVGLIVALLALATDARRSALMLRLGTTVTITVVLGLAVLYLELFDVLAPACEWRADACQLLVLGDDRWLSPEQGAFLLVLVWIGLIALNLRRGTLKPRHLPRLLALATALAEDKRFSEICRVTQPHLGLIATTANGKSKGASAAQQDASITLQRLLYRRPDLTRFIALERPVVAVEMMAVESYIVFDFAEQVLRILAANTDSPLFAEVYENQNITSRGYDFPDHNTYLGFLCGDAKQAERLGAWRPVMENALTTLAEAEGGPYQAYLNSPADRFHDEGKWRDPTFVAIRFLDLMVDAAMRQGVAWHMWLFYTPHLTESLLDLYDDPRKDDEVFDEWPTRNAYLLYATFKAMTGWVEAVEDLPDGSPHLTLNSVGAAHQNDNIPKSAIIALGDCLRQVLMAEAVSDRFKDYLAEVVFRCVTKLPAEGDKAGFRQSLVASLLAGGPMREADHLPRLHEAFAGLDHILRERLYDVWGPLEAALESWPARPGVPQ